MRYSLNREKLEPARAFLPGGKLTLYVWLVDKWRNSSHNNADEVFGRDRSYLSRS